MYTQKSNFFPLFCSSDRLDNVQGGQKIVTLEKGFPVQHLSQWNVGLRRWVCLWEWKGDQYRQIGTKSDEQKSTGSAVALNIYGRNYFQDRENDMLTCCPLLGKWKRKRAAVIV